jgi:spore coat polysaccharide biosynthesis protein SpsF
LFEKHPGEIACVITEPQRSMCGNGCNCAQGPASFLKEAIDLAHEHGALFIIDEMITGFKTALPGSMTAFGLEPDMATWGKGIANGFSFCALTGKRDVMELGSIMNEGEDKVFLISTTHGGETHTMAAALATIKEFKTKDVVAHNHRIGDLMIAGCLKAIEENNLSNHISIQPANWMLAFVFKDSTGEISSGMRTLFLQEMIARGVLFQGAFIPCFSHSEEDVNYFMEAFRESLVVFSEALKNGFEKYLIGKPAKPVFRKKQ